MALLLFRFYPKSKLSILIKFINALTSIMFIRHLKYIMVALFFYL